MSETILAVDQGVAGGFAIWTVSYGIKVFPMPKTTGDIVEMIAGFNSVSEGGARIAIVEEQRGFVRKDQPAEMMAASLFKFGRGVGFLQGCLQMSGWRYEEVNPRKWQAGLSLGGKKSHATKALWKGHLKNKAQQFYPGLKITLATCDALLIMEWYLKQRGVPQQAPLLS